MYFKVNRWLRHGYKENIYGLNWQKKFSLVIFEQFHHFRCEFSCRNSTEKFAMVICTYSVQITMEDSKVINSVY